MSIWIDLFDCMAMISVIILSGIPIRLSVSFIASFGTVSYAF